ncbi:hypothetical protein HPY86_02130 [candidate division WOR-3 bacterium]|nr:hypothetical protein [candidate division WOR-3 bacterium]
MVKSYEVMPVRADWSGWIKGSGTNGYVSQTITCNFDSLVYVELFAVARSAGRRVRLEVWDGEKKVMWGTAVQNRNSNWVRFEKWSGRYSFTRGKHYEFRFTGAEPDSIRFYYDQRNPYQYGRLLSGFASDSADLCMRVYGVMKTIDSGFWGAEIAAYDTTAARKRNVPQLVQNAGVYLDRIDLVWNWVWPDSSADFDFTRLDPAVFFSIRKMGCKVIGILDYSATWAGTRFDAPEFSPPRNLFLDVWHPSNYWARYVEGVVRHYYNTLKLIDVYEVWNEPNDTARFWKPPQFHYDIADNRQGLCSLYARLVEVAATVIDSISQGQAKVLIGSLVATQPSIFTRIAPEEMLSYCYRLVPKKLWSGVSFHPYQDWGFDANLFEMQVESLRTVMHANGDYSELWITEIGFPSFGPNGKYREREQANRLAKAFVATCGSQSLPGGGYDRICFYSFLTRGNLVEGSYGLLNARFQPKPGYYALAQTFRILRGKRCNGRVISGDARDDSVRIYEFEQPLTGKRVWVVWRNQFTDKDTVNTVLITLPVGCDTLEVIHLAYDDNPAVKMVEADADGMLRLNVGVQPVFIYERSASCRPDLAIESVQISPGSIRLGERLMVKLWLRNIGNRSYSGEPGCRIRFYLNGILLTDTLVGALQLNLTPQQLRILTFEIPSDSISFEGEALFWVDVNPTEDFVELSRDNNRFYQIVRRIKL